MRANNADGAPSADQVYNAIYHYVSHWSIAPTIRELAEDLNCGHSTVQRRILELEKSGSIAIHGKKSRGIVIKGKK